MLTRERVGMVVDEPAFCTKSGWLNSNRSSVEFQVRRPFGTTVPRKKMMEEFSVSAVTLSELMVKVSDCVPPIVVEAALMLLAVSVPT